MIAADYECFLDAKRPPAPLLGFACSLDEVPTHLTDGRPIKPHQRACIAWAVRGGRRGLFQKFGLGKSIQQLLILDIIIRKMTSNDKAKHRGLIVAPLGVRQEFRRDAVLAGVDLTIIRATEDIDGPGIYLTHYEAVRDGKIDVGLFDVVSLDEASVLRSYGSKTYQTFLPLFATVPFRFVATATPSPNRYKELIHYAGFLGIMDTGHALTRFFQRNSEKAGDLTLYPHKEVEFWEWLNSWAVFLQAPSDLGFSDEGYDLPPLEVLWHPVQVDLRAEAGSDDRGQGLLLRNAAMGITQAAKEKRISLSARVDKLMEIVRNANIGRTESLSAGVFREEQREAPSEAAHSECGKLPGQPGTISSEVESLEGCEPGAVSRTGATEPGCPTGGTAGDQSGLVSGQQGPRERAKSDEKAAKLRADGSDVSGACEPAGRRLRDLSGSSGSVVAGGEALRRPLSRDGNDQGVAVSAMQLGAGNAERQPGVTSKRRGLSEQVIIWCDLNDEQAAIEKALASEGISCTSLAGSQDVEDREVMLSEWIAGETDVLLTKPRMYGSGANLQQASLMIFAGVGFKFNDTIQAVHRVYRFGQKGNVVVHFIHSETESEVVRELRAKWDRHDQLTARMSLLIRERGLGSLEGPSIARSMGVERKEFSGQNWRLAHNDCVAEVARMAADSVDLVLTSIPFGNQYEYTPSYNDFGHSDDSDHFFEQMDFLTPDLMRVVKPGRMACIHVKDRILFGAVTGEGVPTIEPFSDLTVAHFRKHGWQFMSRITVTTDVVRENNQTYRLSYGEMLKDSTKMGTGMPEYVLVFRRPQSDRSRGYADAPVIKAREDYSLARWQVDAHAYWKSSGTTLLTSDELGQLPTSRLPREFAKATRATVYDYEAHIDVGETVDGRDGNDPRGSLPKTFMSLAPASNSDDVWTDVTRMRTLNADQQQGGREKHLCPLQIDIVDRLINRFSMAGEEVFDPFAGIGTVPVRALKLGRRGSGSELNADYVADAARYCRSAEAEADIPDLFELLGIGKAA
jgi:DNA modification methylase